MGHFLVLGLGPLLVEGTRLFHAGGNRTWHLAHSLRQAGHKVTLLCMRVASREARSSGIRRTQIEGITYVSVDEVKHFAQDSFLHQFIEEVNPDALVGTCAYPAARAACVAGNRPLWADLHGYHMGEAQAKAFRDQEDGFRFHFWDRYRPTLERADRFSTTSEPHKYALIGELGVVGRLNSLTFGEELIHVIPIAWPTVPLRATRKRNAPDPFLVFWSGGFNTWCDIRTLAEAMSRAMERDQRIRFLSTGGCIDGHDEKTYPEFREMVRASPFRSRFDLRGWVPSEQLRSIHEQVDLAINVDRFCYETVIGARNRITEMMARGIPVLTTLGTEISQVLRDHNAGLVAPTGDADTLARRILWAVDHSDELSELALRARKLFEERYTYSATAEPLLDWAKNPVRSGDGGKGVPLLIISPAHGRPGGIRGRIRGLFQAAGRLVGRKVSRNPQAWAPTT